jgi:diguanylate cyclase (GGDEF)-like protein
MSPGGPRLPLVANPSPPPTPPSPGHYRLVVTCGILAVLAIVAGVTAVLLDEAVLGLVAAAVGVAAAGIGAFVEARRQRAEDSLFEARSQARRLRRQLEQLEAEAAEEQTIESARALDGELPDGTDTTDWEIDPVSGLIRARHLPVVLQQVLASARRKVQPVAVVYWEVDGLADASPSACDDALTALGAVAWHTLRESDALFRLGERVAVGVLVDTAERGAAVVAERVRTSLRSSPVGDTLTVSAGIACYPTHALDAMELVSRAGTTLDAARAGGGASDHIAVADPSERGPYDEPDA